MRPLAKLTGRRKGLTIDVLGDGYVDEDGYWPSNTAWGSREEVSDGFDGYIAGVYKRNGIVFACIEARANPFSEARFQYQRFNSGRPGDLFGDPTLALLENPWPNGTTGELLHRMEQDASLAGNFYATTVGTGANRRIRRLRPDYVTIVSGIRGDPEGSPLDIDAEVIGYIYKPPPTGSSRDPKAVLLTPDQVVHYSPLPDPEAQWRGMSWLTPVLREIQADTATTLHKQKFFENGATINFAIKYDANLTIPQVKEAAAFFKESHQGADNAYKVLHIGRGGDPTVIGTSLKDLDFKAVQGAGETRIAAAAGVGSIIARFSEGLQGSALNQGNYAAAKRQFSDMTLRPLWRTAAAALSKFAQPPGGCRLWVDARDIAFLAEDQKSAAEILAANATTINSLVMAGYKPDSVVRAVQADDLNLLEHSGLYSVQLHPPGASTIPSPTGGQP